MTRTKWLNARKLHGIREAGMCNEVVVLRRDMLMNCRAWLKKHQQEVRRQDSGWQKRTEGLLTTVGKLEWQHAALMQMELILVWLGDMEHFHVTVLHPHCEPLSSWAVAQRKYLELKQETVIMATEDTLPLTGRHCFFWGYYLNYKGNQDYLHCTGQKKSNPKEVIPN